MPALTGDDGVPSGFTPNRPFGVWGDSGDGGLAGGGNGVLSVNSRHAVVLVRAGRRYIPTSQHLSGP